MKREASRLEIVYPCLQSNLVFFIEPIRHSNIQGLAESTLILFILKNWFSKKKITLITDFTIKEK